MSKKTETQGKLVFIPISKLAHHPDNPRKDLGDLTELSDSIKKNGVLQNLTVVPWFSTVTGVGADDPKQQEEMGYYVVIGNRRLEASKKAGLEELPCVIAEMSRPEQVSTMLVENMQRNDLTVYEQAQGFQMMLDLGDTVESIAEKSGFSQTTVRRRVKLLELDKEKFKESEQRGVTLFEYMELEKIKDIELRNKVLESAGTENFKYRLRQAIDEESRRERVAKLDEVVSKFAIKVDSDNGYQYVKSWSSSTKPEEITAPDDAAETQYYYTIEIYGYIRLLKERETPNQEEIEKKERTEAERQTRIDNLSEMANRAFELRKEFANSVTATCIKKNLLHIVAFWYYIELNMSNWSDEDEILDILGYVENSDADDDDFEMPGMDFIADAVSKSPEKKLWQLILHRFQDDKTEHYYRGYYGDYQPNEHLTNFYNLLVKLGYEMSDEEKQLQDGSHPLFLRKESEEKDG